MKSELAKPRVWNRSICSMPHGCQTTLRGALLENMYKRNIVDFAILRYAVSLTLRSLVPKSRIAPPLALQHTRHYCPDDER